MFKTLWHIVCHLGLLKKDRHCSHFAKIQSCNYRFELFHCSATLSTLKSIGHDNFLK